MVEQSPKNLASTIWQHAAHTTDQIISPSCFVLFKIDILKENDLDTGRMFVFCWINLSKFLVQIFCRE